MTYIDTHAYCNEFLFLLRFSIRFNSLCCKIFLPVSMCGCHVLAYLALYTLLCPLLLPQFRVIVLSLYFLYFIYSSSFCFKHVVCCVEFAYCIYFPSAYTKPLHSFLLSGVCHFVIFFLLLRAKLLLFCKRIITESSIHGMCVCMYECVCLNVSVCVCVCLFNLQLFYVIHPLKSASATTRSPILRDRTLRRHCTHRC